MINKQRVTLDDLRAQRDEILRLAAHYGAYNVRVFGSVAREDNTLESDVDLLVSFPPRYKLLDHAALLMDLEALLGISVDLSVEANLKAVLRERILGEAIPL